MGLWETNASYGQVAGYKRKPRKKRKRGRRGGGRGVRDASRKESENEGGSRSTDVNNKEARQRGNNEEVKNSSEQGIGEEEERRGNTLEVGPRCVELAVGLGYNRGPTLGEESLWSRQWSEGLIEQS